MVECIRSGCLVKTQTEQTGFHESLDNNCDDTNYNIITATEFKLRTFDTKMGYIGCRTGQTSRAAQSFERKRVKTRSCKPDLPFPYTTRNLVCYAEARGPLWTLTNRYTYTESVTKIFSDSADGVRTPCWDRGHREREVPEKALGGEVWRTILHATPWKGVGKGRGPGSWVLTKINRQENTV